MVTESEDGEDNGDDESEESEESEGRGEEVCLVSLSLRFSFRFFSFRCVFFATGFEGLGGGLRVQF